MWKPSPTELKGRLYHGLTVGRHPSPRRITSGCVPQKIQTLGRVCAPEFSLPYPSVKSPEKSQSRRWDLVKLPTFLLQHQYFSCFARGAFSWTWVHAQIRLNSHWSDVLGRCSDLLTLLKGAYVQTPYILLHTVNQVTQTMFDEHMQPFAVTLGRSQIIPSSQPWILLSSTRPDRGQHIPMLAVIRGECRGPKFSLNADEGACTVFLFPPRCLFIVHVAISYTIISLILRQSHLRWPNQHQRRYLRKRVLLTSYSKSQPMLIHI